MSMITVSSYNEEICVTIGLGAGFCDLTLNLRFARRCSIAQHCCLNLFESRCLEADSIHSSFLLTFSPSGLEAPYFALDGVTGYVSRRGDHYDHQLGHSGDQFGASRVTTTSRVLWSRLPARGQERVEVVLVGHRRQAGERAGLSLGGFRRRPQAETVRRSGQRVV